MATIKIITSLISWFFLSLAYLAIKQIIKELKKEKRKNPQSRKLLYSQYAIGFASLINPYFSIIRVLERWSSIFEINQRIVIYILFTKSNTGECTSINTQDCCLSTNINYIGLGFNQCGATSKSMNNMEHTASMFNLVLIRI